MNDLELEKKVFMILKEMEIVPKGFYRYQEYSDLIGEKKPSWPLTTPLKIMAEIIQTTITEELVSGFIKSYNDNQASHAIIFGINKKIELDEKISILMQKNNIDYFGIDDIEKLIDEKSLKVENINEYQKASEIVAPKPLIDSLDELAHQKVPDTIMSTIKFFNDVDWPAWNIFEEAVFAAFSYCIGYEVRQLGKEKLFQKEPEGVAIVQTDGRWAFLYECKTASSAYKMTVEHQRAYIEYIKKKKSEISALDGAELRYFVIIGPDFEGDIEGRRNEIYKETGVLAVYVKASTLSNVANWAHKIDNKLKKMIDLGEIFSIIGEDIVTDNSIKKFIENFDQKYKVRY